MANPIAHASVQYGNAKQASQPPGEVFAPFAASNKGAQSTLERLDDLMASLRRTVASVPSVAATLQASRRTLHHTLPGMAIAGASSFAFAQTITPALLRVSAQTMDVAETLKTIPVVGGVLAKVMGAGGHLGLWGGTACLLSATLVLLTSTGSVDKRLKWAAAHLAQGFSLAPFWALATAGTLPGALPGLVLAVGCSFGVSVVLARVMDGERADWTSGVMVAALSAAGGPLAAQLALGVELALAVTAAGFSLALGALGATLLVWSSHFAALEDDSTALLRSFFMKPDKSRWLELPGDTQRSKLASVFVDRPALLETVISIRNNLDRGGALHSERLLLCGPPGTGKSDIAKSLQNEFGWKAYNPPSGHFTDSATPATNITEVMNQAAREAKRQGRPVMLVFDEAEKLFPIRSDLLDTGTIKGDATYMMTSTFNDMFEGVNSSRYASVFVIVISNHPEEMDPALLSRFSGHRQVDVGYPTVNVMRKIIATRWRAKHNEFAGIRAEFFPYVPDELTVERLAQLCLPQLLDEYGAKTIRLSGRDLDEAVTASLKAANAELGGIARAGKPDQARFEELLQQRFATALDKHFADARSHAEAARARSGAESKADNAASKNGEAAHTRLSKLAQQMQRILAESTAFRSSVLGAPHAAPQSAPSVPQK